MYSGDKCETQSNELKAVKAIISFTSILAIIIIGLFYGCIVAMDLSKIFCKRYRNVRARRHIKPFVQRHNYIN